ncbi:hypothetical protein [Succinimonas sp.]|uniref:hypothetical protein n=1 Tax=Succinimonas sp. TaxID=1936151 RepID=UPI003866816E
MGQVSVFALDTLSMAICNLRTAQRETYECCDDGICKAEQILQDTESELQRSRALLEAARVVEAAKLALLGKAEVRMARAVAEEAAALASCNPLAIAAATAEVAAASAELAEATEGYQKAREHRERLEHRRDLAQKCVDLAQANLEMLRLRYQYGKMQVGDIVIRGCNRLQAAHADLEAYLARISPQARQIIHDYKSWEPKEKKPIEPKEVHDRLNPDETVVDGVLEYIYATDLRFHASIDRLSAQMRSSENTVEVEAKIKKNVVGRLCEELVIRAFQPMGEHIEQQHVCYLDNGSFTKVDMILYGLKEPLILGRGEGMGGKKGGSLAIEVKSGKAEYIYSQIAHMENQAKGHASCDISCTVCTRDINDLSPEQKEEVKNCLKAAGSPILGMLPRKSELDTRCIRFVKAKARSSNDVQ